jgi:hypothetical protein
MCVRVCLLFYFKGRVSNFYGREEEAGDKWGTTCARAPFRNTLLHFSFSPHFLYVYTAQEKEPFVI